MASNLTATWYNIFGIMIFSSTLTTNLIPYIAVLIDFASQRLLKNKGRSQKPFQIERKYAQLLQTIFIVFTYGFGLPILFLSCMGIVTLLIIVDKFLITYWFRPRPLQSDLLNRTFLQLVKYAPCLFLGISGGTIMQNYCMYSNKKVGMQQQFNEYVDCRHLGPLPLALIVLSVSIFLILVVTDILFVNYEKNRFKIAYSHTDYFSQLSEL